MNQDKKREKMQTIFNQVDAVNKLYELWAREHGIRYNHFLLYYYLLDKERMTQSQFCDELELPRQTVNSMIKKLEAEGKVKLVASKTSLKEKSVVLTENGRHFAEGIINPLYRIEAQAGDFLTADEYNQLFSLLDSFASQMEQSVTDYLNNK